MGTLTLGRSDNLFWLGRYIERAYQSIQLYMNGYDRMIDEDDENEPTKKTSPVSLQQ